MKVGKQRGRHNNSPLEKPSGASEMTQRVSLQLGCFSATAERARTCWAQLLDLQ